MREITQEELSFFMARQAEEGKTKEETVDNLIKLLGIKISDSNK